MWCEGSPTTFLLQPYKSCTVFRACRSQLAVIGLRVGLRTLEPYTVSLMPRPVYLSIMFISKPGRYLLYLHRAVYRVHMEGGSGKTRIQRCILVGWQGAVTMVGRCVLEHVGTGRYLLYALQLFLHSDAELSVFQLLQIGEARGMCWSRV